METTPFWYIVLTDVVKVIGVAVAWWWTWKKYLEAKDRETKARHAEAMRPFLELRQKCYLETVHAAAILSNHKLYSPDEILAAKKRFCELYVAELSMVEPRGVETKMRELAEKIAPELVPLNSEQEEAYKLAHVLRDSFIKSWGLSKEDVHLSDTPKKNPPPLCPTCASTACNPPASSKDRQL